MTSEDLAYSGIAEIAPLLRSGQLSPVELTQACLDRVAALDGRINAFITLLADSALAEARQAEQDIRAGKYRGPLHGIPITQKDLYYTRGVRTTAGSKVLSDFVPDYDATVVSRLKAAGTVLLGKLNMHEFAAGGTNDNPHYGPVHNPWNLSCIPGGSSGGSAAALAAGMCLGSTGTDTAGSIRIPSHCCGTSGIKPTYGRVSSYGVFPLSWELDHAGPMARSAEDAALMLNAIAGYDPADPYSADRPVPDFAANIHSGVRGLRIGVPVNYFNELLQQGVEQAWHAAIRTLTDLGAAPVEVSFSAMDRAVWAGTTILPTECTAIHEEWYRQRPGDYGAGMVQRFESNANVTAVQYIKAQRTRHDIRADLRSAFEKADVILTPTMPITATPIGATEVDIRGTTYPLSSQMVRFTYPFNLSGFPALSIPCGFDPAGLPIGLQIAGNAWDEATVLRVGHAYQQATAWHTRRPELS